MEKIIKKIISKLFPELAAGYHLPKYAQVVRVAKPPSEGDLSTAFEPFYAVDIQLLTNKGKIDATKPIYESVPMTISSGSSSQGQYGFPKTGVWVIVEFAYGSPEHPMIVGILPHRTTLPSVPVGDLLLQLTNETFLRAKKEGTWQLQAKKDIDVKAEKIEIGNGDINLLAEVRALAEMVENHTHSGVASGGSSTAKPTQSSQAKNVKKNIDSITK